MPSETEGLFDAVARIEREADEIVALAKAAARKIQHDTEKKAADLAAETQERIEADSSALAKENDAATRAELQSVQHQFELEKQRIDRVRAEKMDALANWASEQISRHCLKN